MYRSLARLAQGSFRELVEPSWKRGVSATLKKFPGQSYPYDGCTSASYIAYAWSEQAFIYPITPATPMGDVVASWAAQGRKNLFGSQCNVTQMQSEGGAAGACHGVVDVGSLATTFTSSQGLLLMVPNMYIIAGALNPCVFHVAARSVTKHALCIFGDHTDVMATRQTGFALLSGHNGQQSMDMGLVSHVASLKSSVPFMNFFDGFRTSHEISKVETIPYEAMEQLIPHAELAAYRSRGLNPNRPHSRQLGQFADTFFQNSEAANLYFDRVPSIVQKTMDDVGAITGRHYKIMEYVGHPQAEQVVVAMGSGCSTVEALMKHDNERGEKFGMIKIHLFRPWDAETFLSCLPHSVKRIAVLDRTKEQASIGEPLFMDVAATLQTVGNNIKVVGGRYGLGSKDFTPGMVRAVFENLKHSRPTTNFSVGIEDDITFRSLKLGAEPDVASPDTRQCMFWGMGSDGTISANKNTIKMIADNTSQYVQGYFAYDSKKAGGCTISHLRFGPDYIDAPYSIMSADYIACSQRTWPQKFPNVMLATLKNGGTTVFNSASKTADEFEAEMPHPILNQIAAKNANVYTIDASRVARENGLGRHTNNVLTAVFFKLADILPFEQAEALLKQSMRKAYAAKGEELVQRNMKGVDAALANLIQIEVPVDKWLNISKDASLDPSRPVFCTELMDKLNALEGDTLPVSSFDPRGHYPPATTQYEKRGIALTVPIVDMDKCTQCNKCSAICPHAAIRPFLVSQLEADQAPGPFDMRMAKGGNDVAGMMFRIQVAPEDCTGCEACSWACPDDALTMTPLDEVIERERSNWTFAAKLPERGYMVDRHTLKGSQFQKPMLEFSGACEGCGETPYAKLVTQLFGERMIIANASGCSSVWAGTAAFNPLAVNHKGQGPAWGRSLFEDAAEYGLGMARAVQDRRTTLAEKMQDLISDEDYKPLMPVPLLQACTEWLEKRNDPVIAQELTDKIPAMIESTASLKQVALAQEVLSMKDYLPKLSSWVWGGDGWAYDIGFGGLDHVLAAKTDINVLVMDTEGYSNTGGQVSKSTNLGAVQKFAPAGYRRAKKDLGAIAMAYEDVYVGSIAIGANYAQSVKTLTEAEAYPGASLILCYSPCIEHKILFPRGLSRLGEEMKKAVDSGYWALYRFNPALAAQGENPFTLDSKRLAMAMEDFTKLENRFQILNRTHPDVAQRLRSELQVWAEERHERLKWMASRGSAEGEAAGPPLSILYGSDTGTTTELASRIAAMCRSRQFAVSLFELDEVTPDQLQAMSNVMVLCSTAGEGDLPQNAHAFWENISDGSLEPGYLSDTKLAVFGLGDTGYKHFNAAAKNIQQRLEELGAQRWLEIGLGDDKHDDKYETELEKWLPNFWEASNAADAPDEHEIADPIVALEPVENKADFVPVTVRPPGTKMITLEKNVRLTSADYDRTIRHLVFDLPAEQDFSYLLGDALTVYPTNDPTKVNEFLEWYGINTDDVYKVSAVKPLDPRRAASYRHAMGPTQIFSEVVDILGRPNKHFYKQLAKFAVDPAEKAEMDLITSDTPEGQAKYAELVKETVTYVDVLKMFPSAHPPMEHLMSLIPCVKPRLYSIASSQRYINNKVELAIVILDWKTPNGKPRRGLATDYIQRLATDGENAGSKFIVPCSVTPGTFNFPASLTTPQIMAGLGTGLAPFRAFVQERAWHMARGEKTGPMWLFYGCRYRSKDYIFGDELTKYAEDGVITELQVAFSRDQEKKVYVQNKIDDNSEAIYQDLIKNEGYFYLCGQAGQVELDIKDAMYRAIANGEGCSKEEAMEKFEELADEGRYCPELY